MDDVQHRNDAVESGHRSAQVHDFRGARRKEDVQSKDDPRTGELLPCRCRSAGGKYL